MTPCATTHEGQCRRTASSRIPLYVTSIFTLYSSQFRTLHGQTENAGRDNDSRSVRPQSHDSTYPFLPLRVPLSLFPLPFPFSPPFPFPLLLPPLPLEVGPFKSS